MEKLCVIFGAGDTYSPRTKYGCNDLIIAADGGYKTAARFNIEPSVIIGDFDSSDMPEGTPAHIVKLNRDKDDTDTLAAVKLGLRRGYATFVIYGGVGGRLDHTVANIATLAYLNAFGARGFLIDKDSVATVITDDKLVLPASARGTVSVFAYGGVASGVTLKNLKFPLDNAELTPEFPLGVSNAVGEIAPSKSEKIIEFDNISKKPTAAKGRAEISVKHGSLLIFFPR